MNTELDIENIYKSQKEYLKYIKPINKIDPLVSIFVITYQHANYISECLDGLLMQKTNFKFEIVIGEDCSVDNTRNICEEYALKYSSINLLPTNKNLGMIPNTIRTHRACKGKYTAFCEGDDYWTDPYKLQKQVDFLETHPDYGLVHSNYDKLYEKTGRLVKMYIKNNEILYPSRTEIFNGILTNKYRIATLTVLARTELLSDAINNFDVSRYLMSDLPTWLEMAQQTKFHYFKESFGVYRKVQGSASNINNNYWTFIKSSNRIKLDFANKYSTPMEIKSNLQRAYLKSLLLEAFYSENQQLATRYRNYMEEYNIALSPFDKLIYLSINNKTLYTLFLSFDKINKIIVFTIRFILRKNI